MPHTWLNIEEVASYLRVSVADVQEWARCAEIPCTRRGDRYLFRRSEIERWASRRLLESKPGEIVGFHRPRSRDEGPTPILDRLMRPEWIEPSLTSRTRASVIRDMVDFAGRTGLLNYPEDLLAAVLAREDDASTALEGGVALLHAANREPYMLEDSFILLGRTCQLIPFGAPDGRGTDIFFLVCCVDEHQHLQALARLCLVCLHTDMLMVIRSLEKAAAIYAALMERERMALDKVLANRRR